MRANDITSNCPRRLLDSIVFVAEAKASAFCQPSDSVFFGKRPWQAPYKRVVSIALSREGKRGIEG